MRDVGFVRVALVANGLVPLALIGWDAATGDLGANPVEFVLRSTGTMALVFLVLTLAVTPARRLLGLPWLTKLRRTLGLMSFGYACLHVTIYLTLDQGLSLSAIASDAITRPFVTLGMLAFGFMVPLASTSTNAAIRRLGPRWSQIHRRIYAVAVFAGLHYWLEVKADVAKPAVFLAAIALLLFYRYVNRRDRRPSRPPTSRGTSRR